jgi:hypothetical protein
VLKIFGLRPVRRSASFKARTQKALSIVLLISHARTARLCQSMIATR